MRSPSIAMTTVLLAVGLAFAQATPPDVLNYQGVLRDSSDVPLDGSHDMLFRFYDAATGGNEILIDAHDALNGNPVTVSGGLFNVELGGGVVSDGSGGGVYGSLAEVFRDHGELWMSVEVGSEVLSPRIRIVSAGYALNASHLDGLDGTQVLRSDASDTFGTGTLTLGGAATLDVQGAMTKTTTDLVPNLNADLLDGVEASALAPAVHGHTGGEIAGPVAEATNADTVDGKHASQFLDTTSTTQTKVGQLFVDSSGVTNSFGVRGYGTTYGGHFADSNDTGYAHVGIANRGIDAYGTGIGGAFYDTDSSGYASVGYGDLGIEARGNEAGGAFYDRNSSGYAFVGQGDRGIEASGNFAGGYFHDADESGYAYVAYGDHGINAYGNVAGGYFRDLNASGYTLAGHGDYGISGYGNNMGGYFEDLDSSGYAYVGHADRGIEARGTEAGGLFVDDDGSGFTWVGYGDRGIDARGSEAGGYFADSDSSGRAYVAYGDRGIEARGSAMGGYFSDPTDTYRAELGAGGWGIRAYGSGGGFFQGSSGSYAQLASGSDGIYADGATYGGYFRGSGGYHARVGGGGYKIGGSGTVSFIQNHPYDDTRVIVYSAPEGDEVATYTRGTARLENGEARVALGETFAWVTNPDIGLTAHVTPRGEPASLAVVSLTTEEMVVRAPADAPPDLAFDFIVYGLRIGFEEATVVRPKKQESYIPSMNHYREMIAADPSLGAYTAMSRFRAMTPEQVELSGSRALVKAIHEYDPATDPPMHELLGHGPGPWKPEDRPVTEVTDDRETVEVAGESQPLETEPTITAPELEAATLFPIGGDVEQGDVLALDPERPGVLVRAATMHDPGFVGIAASDAAEVDGRLHVALVETNYALVKVDAVYGAVRPGDLLTTSPTPGHAMVSIDPQPGTVLGKALESQEVGTGTIRVLVMVR